MLLGGRQSDSGVPRIFGGKFPDRVGEGLWGMIEIRDGTVTEISAEVMIFLW